MLRLRLSDAAWEPGICCGPKGSRRGALRGSSREPWEIGICCGPKGSRLGALRDSSRVV